MFCVNFQLVEQRILCVDAVVLILIILFMLTSSLNSDLATHLQKQMRLRESVGATCENDLFPEISHDYQPIKDLMVHFSLHIRIFLESWSLHAKYLKEANF